MLTVNIFLECLWVDRRLFSREVLSLGVSLIYLLCIEMRKLNDNKLHAKTQKKILYIYTYIIYIYLHIYIYIFTYIYNIYIYIYIYIYILISICCIVSVTLLVWWLMLPCLKKQQLLFFRNWRLAAFKININNYRVHQMK